MKANRSRSGAFRRGSREAALFVSGLYLAACSAKSSGSDTAISAPGDGSAKVGEDSSAVVDADDGLVTLTIQESTTPNTQGFVGISGTGSISVSTSSSVAGWTGNGYIQSTDLSTNIIYSVHAAAPCQATLLFRYAFGGSAANQRDAWVIVNGAKVAAGGDNALGFPYTAPADGGKWNVYANTAPIVVSLVAGDNQIRLAPNTANPAVRGLANLDYLQITGPAISPGTNSTTFYKLSVSNPDPTRGLAAVTPAQDFYLGGATITLTATPYAGFDFESWTGSAPSTRPTYSLIIASDTALSARFVRTGTMQPEGLVGYGAVQDDEATPYIVTGGNDGPTVTVTELTGLATYLISPDPYVIIVAGLITSGSDTVSTSINVASNKTLYGDGTGRLKNIELKLSGENYIVRNLVISEVVAADQYGGTGNDAIQLNGARHLWIDHCELHSSLAVADPSYTGEAKDYYDGLLDIKNGASFVTISYNDFHDHYKVALIGSGDDPTNAVTDGQTRVTMHHNHFRLVNSRLPLIRYGKAHVFNNFYDGSALQIDSTVNARCGSQVLVEGNYTLNAKNTVGFFYDTSGFAPGTWNLRDNTYVTCPNATTTSTGDFLPAYAWSAEPSAGIAASLPDQVGVGRIAVP
jgi:pectate lyase